MRSNTTTPGIFLMMEPEEGAKEGRQDQTIKRQITQ